jgi:predicted ferric reductase
MRKPTELGRNGLIWGALTVAVAGPILLAARSPLLAWRDPTYIAAGFAGIIGLALLFVQPLLGAGRLPLHERAGRWLHRRVGGLLVVAVCAHVAGLWITSPPDVIDALLFASPTPFSVWGVTAMWALFATAGLALSRKALHLAPRVWRRAHIILAVAIVFGTAVHAMLIEGTMEPVSKAVLCALALAATLKVAADQWRGQTSKR